MKLNSNQIREIAKILHSEVEKLSESVHEDLKELAPKTTPSIDNYNLCFGNPNYTKISGRLRPEESQNTNDIDYIAVYEAFIYYYLIKNTSVDVEGYSNINIAEDESYTKLVGILELRIEPQLGSFKADSDTLWTGFIPKNYIEQFKDDLKQEMNPKIFNELKEFPEWYTQEITSRKFDEDYFNEDKILEIASHEINHYFLASNTQIGELKQEILNYEKGGLDAKLEELRNGGKDDLAESVGYNPSIRALDEVFAHWIGFIYLGKRKKVAESYPRYEYIEFGISLLNTKAKREDPKYPVDWARFKLVEVFELIAKRGLVKKGGSRDIFTIFLIQMLPNKQRKKLEKFQTVIERDLSQSFKDLNKLLNDDVETELKGLDDGFKNHIEEVYESLGYAHPENLKDQVLEQLLERAKRNYMNDNIPRNNTLEYIETEIRHVMNSEHENLRNLIDALKKLDDKTRSEKIHERVSITASELETVDNEIRQIIQS